MPCICAVEVIHAPLGQTFATQSNFNGVDGTARL